MFNLNAIQQALKSLSLDGWLLYDFRGLNILARRVLGFDPDFLPSRRWFYFIPASGEPRKLVHAIEPAVLDPYPGANKTVYLRWQELEAGVGSLVKGCKRLAMEYAPRNGNPYVSRVDGGTLELVRSFGPEVVSSGDLVQMFEAVWDDEQWQLHLDAAKPVRESFDIAWAFIADKIRKGVPLTELDVQRRILEHFKANNLTTYHNPNCSVNANSADPHYDPSASANAPIKDGDFVLLDIWAKLDKPRAVYSDLTWVGFVGKDVPEKYTKIFNIVAAARDAGIQKVRDAFAAKKPLAGWEVDDATRAVIDKAGYGQWFCHRTGHNIGQETHGNGANMDNLETREERRVLPRTCFSIEPGIYLPGDFGVRSEVNVYVDASGGVHVTGGDPQTAVVPILSAF
jgi:Xaa-Pro aminopeptidase